MGISAGMWGCCREGAAISPPSTYALGGEPTVNLQHRSRSMWLKQPVAGPASIDGCAHFRPLQSIDPRVGGKGAIGSFCSILQQFRMAAMLLFAARYF